MSKASLIVTRLAWNSTILIFIGENRMKNLMRNQKRKNLKMTGKSQNRKITEKRLKQC